MEIAKEAHTGQWSVSLTGLIEQVFLDSRICSVNLKSDQLVLIGNFYTIT